MTAKKYTIVAAAVFSLLLVPSATGVSYAVYLGNVGESGTTGTGTLEEALALAREKVLTTERNPQAGSGTPLLALDGVVGASALTAGVFGVLAAALIAKGRSGKYAIQGAG